MARFQLAALFSDGAVLCRRKEIRVFGTGEDGARLSCCLLDEGGRTLGQDETVIEKGRFCFCLPPQEARMGCVLTVTDGQEKTICCDIAIGEVFLAGGQSNMELELQNADEGKRLILSHRNPQVRYFNVPKFARFTPDAEEANKNARWMAVAPGAAQDMSAAAYFFAMKLQDHLYLPVGVIDCYWGGTSVTCWMSEETLSRTAEGQRYLKEYRDSWAGKTMDQYLAEEGAFFSGLDEWAKKAEALKAEHPEYTTKELNAVLGPCPPWNPPVGEGSPFRPAGLYHTMLERVVPAALTGVLFYQGEEDTWRTKQYDVLLTSFIFQLRTLFRDGELPFLNVQLPMWIDGAAEEDSKLWPALRLAQEKVWRNVRNTGLAVLIDQGEFDNIHPTNKRVVGERLYETALETIYREPARQPVYALGKRRMEGKLYIDLSAPVAVSVGGEYLMEIAGEDGVFHPADVRIEGRQIILSSPKAPRPLAARYAWTDYAAVCLFGENGLPLAPFLLE
ncbi:MAG: sialate O-acetylesterase [Clostridia bacterium]|nr:sialate O-acetylesterase [Clostridia bacterium]